MYQSKVTLLVSWFSLVTPWRLGTMLIGQLYGGITYVMYVPSTVGGKKSVAGYGCHQQLTGFDTHNEVSASPYA